MFLLLLLVPAVLFLRDYLKPGKAGLRFSSTVSARKVRPSLRQKLADLPVWLRVIALALLVIALARPQEGKDMVRDVSEGVAIEMVVDRSGSMGLMKKMDGRAYTRLDIVKRAFDEFVNGNASGLKGRPNDIIGMTIFARYPDTICPLTLSHGALSRFIASVQVVKEQSEDGTSLGDGVALAAARLATAEETIAKQLKADKTGYRIKSKIMILLTDGMDTGIGRRTPEEGLEIAKKYGIKIYTIGITGDDWYTVVNDPIFGSQMQYVPSNINTAILEKMAGETGGIARTASDLASLGDIYREIDALEKSEIESIRYLDYRELFPAFVIAALVILLAEVFLSSTVFRRIP